LTSGELNLFQQIADRFGDATSHLGAGGAVFGVIHGDFTFNNILTHRDGVRVIDFDDCGLGYFLYDIATLLDRLEWRDDYRVLRAALIEGYRTQRELRAEHEAMLDLFLLTRWAFLGLAFLSAPERSLGRMYAARFMKIVIPKMQKYLLTI
jgi:Ser/Thr protein kinase RdoA (MazF antagonist)